MGKLKVLILGDGLLATEVVKQTNWEYVSRKKDNLNIDKIDEFLENYQCDVILNCIANTNTYSNDFKSHWDTNYKFVHRLINFCNRKNIKLVHISTDYVYTNSISNASEEDVPVHCNSWYCYTKLLSDGLVQLQSNNFLLCRCTHKPNPFPYESAWINQIGNFDYVNEISKIIIKMIVQDLNGLYNVGTEVKTMYELASKTSTVKKSISSEHIPTNLSMNIDKLKKNLV